MPQKVTQHTEKPDYFRIERAVLQYEDIKKEKPELSELYQSMSCAIAVLGAGPSLPSDIEKLPEDRIDVGCNHHAYRLCTPDYMAFLDPPGNNHSDEYRKYVYNPKSIRVSRLIEYTDIYCVNEFPMILDPIGDTGMFATWFACYITSGPVYLCGMGLRRNGEPEHFYNNGQNHHWGGMHYENKTKKWAQVLSYCEKPERIKSISGPLTNLL